MKHTEYCLLGSCFVKKSPLGKTDFKVMSSNAGVTFFFEPLVDKGVTRHFRKVLEWDL